MQMDIILVCFRTSSHVESRFKYGKGRGMFYNGEKECWIIHIHTHAGIPYRVVCLHQCLHKVLFQLLITYFSHTDTLQRDKYLLQPSTEIAWHVFQAKLCVCV